MLGIMLLFLLGKALLLYLETDKAVDRTTDWDFLEGVLKINSKVKLQIRIEDVRNGFEANKTAFEGS